MPTSTSGDGGSAGGGSLDAAAPDGGRMPNTLLEAPAAEQVGSLELDEPIADVVYAEDLVLGLHETSGVSILDLSDPTEPQVISNLPTTGRPVAVTLDVRLRILFIIAVSGDLRAYRVADVTAPSQVAQSSISLPGADGDGIQGMVRIRNRLFVLGAGRLLPVEILLGSGGNIGFLAGSDIDLDGAAQRIESGGSVLFVAFAGGRVEIWSAQSAPEMLDAADLGAEITGWVVRGRRIFVALRGLGLRVVDMTLRGQLRILFEAPEFDDAAGLERHGNLVLVSLSRGLLIALDLSDFTAPRALVSRRGTLPRWMASIRGNLLLGALGTSRQLSVFGVPPFVAASVPQLSRGAFPRYGSIPLQLSKPVDPRTVTADNVQLLCGGTRVQGRVVISLDNLRITFLPSNTLPAGASCRLTLDGVTDALGLRLSAVSSALSFTTASAAPEPVENPHSSYAHTADGQFTDWEEGASEDFEYFDVTPARGMYSYFYADFDGEKLWLLNDWFYNGDDISPDCYNQFGVWTGGGSQRWDIRAYGDQRIEVRLDGELLAEDDARVTGGYGHVGSPNDPEPHTVYEIETEPGSWGVQLHDPGPTFSCHQLETDPTNYNGASTMEASTIDPTQRPSMPAEPIPSTRAVTSVTPALSWSTGDAPNLFTAYFFELGTGEDLSNVIYRVVVYGEWLVLPLGLLLEGMTYTWRVTAYNLAGSVTSDPITFTVGTPSAAVEAPVLGAVEPASVEQNANATLTLTGSGFVMGARAYLGGEQLNTTFVSATELTAMLPESLTGTVGTFDLTVRNLPDDTGTESDALELSVTEPASTAVTLVSLDPEVITAGTGTVVTVNLTNGASGTYHLVLTPSGGSALNPVFCDWIAQNQCQATVNVPADTYDARVTVGEGGSAYDTNTSTSALTVNPAACVHDECLPGARLADGCSFCVSAICDTSPECCTTAWTGTCADTAAFHGSCSCTPPSLVDLSPDMHASGSSTSVTVNLNAAPEGPTYTLVLTPDGGGDETDFACTYADGDCTATVTGLAEDTYDAHVRITNDGQDNDTNTVSSAFQVTAAPATEPPGNAVLVLTNFETSGSKTEGTPLGPGYAPEQGDLVASSDYVIANSVATFTTPFTGTGQTYGASFGANGLDVTGHELQVRLRIASEPFVAGTAIQLTTWSSDGAGSDYNFDNVWINISAVGYNDWTVYTADLDVGVVYPDSLTMAGFQVNSGYDGGPHSTVVFEVDWVAIVPKL